MVWQHILGAHKTGLSSFDYRLRDASNIRTQVTDLLEDLAGLAQDATSIVGGEKTPWDQLKEEPNEELEDGSEDGFDPTELGQVALDVADVVDYLLRLSVAIRNPARHDRFREAHATDTSYFEPFDIQHVHSVFNTAEDWLVERLGKANSRRHQYFNKASNPTQHRPSVFEDNDSDTQISQTSFATSVAASRRLKMPSMPEDAHKGLFQCPFCYMVISLSLFPLPSDGDSDSTDGDEVVDSTVNDDGWIDTSNPGRDDKVSDISQADVVSLNDRMGTSDADNDDLAMRDASMLFLNFPVNQMHAAEDTISNNLSGEINGEAVLGQRTNSNAKDISVVQDARDGQGGPRPVAAEEKKKEEDALKKRVLEAKVKIVEDTKKMEQALMGIEEAAKKKADEEAASLTRLEEDTEAKLEDVRAELEAALKEQELKMGESLKAKQEKMVAATKAEKEAKEAAAGKAADETAWREALAPIKFKDAIRRKFIFPYHLCQT
ncbi:hypothetical protein B0H67DRAFT_648202 [Lasiosphaeris hirsuta]|uniref:Uncharacterized protein n=1 Tax=Lasiosphaeris hirsuta TaxID=260670 RepID=A0AA40A2I4_9PEZI|nr:hypothetical protein B0H67DRAFT_648202 [Lasiosphaeris hirsuta]